MVSRDFAVSRISTGVRRTRILSVVGVAPVSGVTPSGFSAPIVLVFGEDLLGAEVMCCTGGDPNAMFVFSLVAEARVVLQSG